MDDEDKGGKVLVLVHGSKKGPLNLKAASIWEIPLLAWKGQRF